MRAWVKSCLKSARLVRRRIPWSGSSVTMAARPRTTARSTDHWPGARGIYLKAASVCRLSWHSPAHCLRGRSSQSRSARWIFCRLRWPWPGRIRFRKFTMGTTCCLGCRGSRTARAKNCSGASGATSRCAWEIISKCVVIAQMSKRSTDVRCPGTLPRIFARTPVKTRTFRWRVRSV